MVPVLPPAGAFVVTYRPSTRWRFSIFAALCLLLSEFGAARRRAEQALRESEARFRKLTAVSPPTWYWKQRRRAPAVHRRDGVLREGSGRPRPVSDIGKTRWELPGTLAVGLMATSIARCSPREQPFRDFEYSRTDQAGATRYISVSGLPMFDDAGRLQRLRRGRHPTSPSRKLAEAERQAHVWFLESMDRINRAMQGTNDLERMMSDVLDAVLERLACDRAWLLYPCDPDAPSWRRRHGAHAAGVSRAPSRSAVALPAMTADSAASLRARRSRSSGARPAWARAYELPG